jgi:hypothetical protein
MVLQTTLLSRSPAAARATLSKFRPALHNVSDRIFLGDFTEYLVQSGETRWRAHAAPSQRFAPATPYG